MGHAGQSNSNRRSGSPVFAARDGRSGRGATIKSSTQRSARPATRSGCCELPRCQACALGSCTNLKNGVVRLPSSSSTPRPGPRSAHGPRVACPPQTLRTRRCGPRATRTGAPGHQQHVGEPELSLSTGLTVSPASVHCRPAAAGGGSPNPRHPGSPQLDLRVRPRVGIVGHPGPVLLGSWAGDGGLGTHRQRPDRYGAGPGGLPRGNRRARGLLLKDVLDLLAGLLDVAAGLVLLAFGLHVQTPHATCTSNPSRRQPDLSSDARCCVGPYWLTAVRAYLEGQGALRAAGWPCGARTAWV